MRVQLKQNENFCIKMMTSNTSPFPHYKLQKVLYITTRKPNKKNKQTMFFLFLEFEKIFIGSGEGSNLRRVENIYGSSWRIQELLKPDDAQDLLYTPSRGCMGGRGEAYYF